jgi:hypothetical protein
VIREGRDVSRKKIFARLMMLIPTFVFILSLCVQPLEANDKGCLPPEVSARTVRASILEEANNTFSMPPKTEWNRTYAGLEDERAGSIIQTGDGGYALAGIKNSSTSSFDFWLVKTDAYGNMEWNKTYGGPEAEMASCVLQTINGGYILVGDTGSFGAGSADFWLVKTDAYGNMEWNKTYGGPEWESAECMVQTGDGGYALVGLKWISEALKYDFWLVRVDAFGNEQWNKTYGGPEKDLAWWVVQTSDGGYALTGYKYDLAAEDADFWLVKTDAYGNMEWNKTYGGPELESAECMVQTGDGGYALAGITGSRGAGSEDFWLVRVDAFGNEQWNKTYGGPENDEALSIVRTSNGEYVLAGRTHSFGAAGLDDGWLVMVDAFGNEQWNKTYGGLKEDHVLSVVQTSDGGYALAGWTSSFGVGGNDFWLIKLGSCVFSCSPEALYINESAQFDASDGCNSYTWDFGDGNITAVSVPTISHSYSSMGMYTVVLNVTKDSLWNTTMSAVMVTFRSDLNKDGKVNIQDVVIAAVAYDSQPDDPRWNGMADLDKNGMVNIVDISRVAIDYGKVL